MLFNYKATSKDGTPQSGSIDAPNIDLAITALQRRDLIVLSIAPEKTTAWWKDIRFFQRVSSRDIVILSRQVATLFEAKVSVLATFRLLSAEAENPLLREKLMVVTEDIKGGTLISAAMQKHPEVFSDFYVNMVKSGEESGKLSETFSFLADYLDRTYALASRAKNALIYPAFVVISFVVVMILMMTFVIPKLSDILAETGQELPIYTQLIVDVSNLFVNYGLLMLAVFLILVVVAARYFPTPKGQLTWSKFQLAIPYVGVLYEKLYLSRIADNLNTLITSGVSMVRALEITAEVVGNEVYKAILLEANNAVKGGSALSDVLNRHTQIPGIMIQMIKVGEESGKLGFVLNTMARFYQREVDNEVDTLVGLIEPIMIVALGLMVGILLTAVLVPIYNVASSF
jgi:type IV pilus assembly protein PilC